MADPIRTGLVGFGLAGQVFHGPLLSANSRYSLDYVVTSNPTRAAAAARVARHVVPSLDQLLEHSGQLDLVVVITPPQFHVAQTRAALLAGLAVVVDKPFAPTVVEGQELIALARQRGLPLTVFQSRRWDGDFLTVHDLVQSGELGQVHRFESSFERWQPMLRVQWHGEVPPEQGGGTLFDTGSHVIDQALHLFGPAKLEHGHTAYLSGDQRSDDEAVVLLRHESGTLSHLIVSRMAGQVGARFRVLGSRGGFVCHGVDGQEAALKAGLSPTDPAYGLMAEADWGMAGIPGRQRTVPMRRGSYPEFYSLLASTLSDGGKVPVDPASSVEVIRIIQEIHALSRP